MRRFVEQAFSVPGHFSQACSSVQIAVATTGLLGPDGKDGIPARTICSESLALEFDGHQQFIGVVLAGINDNAVIGAAFGFDLNRMGLQ